MITRPRGASPIWALAIVWAIALTIGLLWTQTAGSQSTGEKPNTKPVQKWTKVTVELPRSDSLFPPGDGADLANGECLICHSAGMVLRQPPLTEEEWRGEINKMRHVFGAPVPENQVDALAKYLNSINGTQSKGGRPTPDGQGS
jgi:mono/diheme cytochrome c family protein